MLGLAVLFFLGLWLLITLWATRVGWRWGKKYPNSTWRKWPGAFLGFFVTFGWFVALESYRFTREQIWVTKFCTENPRLKIYITPEQFAEILKTGDASAYRQAQPQYREVDEEHIEINSDVFTWQHHRGQYAHYKVRLYTSNLNWRYTYYAKTSLVYAPYGLVLLQFSEANTTARGWLGLKYWYNAVSDCKIKSEDYSSIDEYLISYRHETGDKDEK